jgi:hypothetical protein
MARNITIGGDGSLFIGEDKTLRLEVLDASDVPVDMTTGWTVTFDVRLNDVDPSPVLLSKAATISGTYSATRAANTQRAVVALSDDEMTMPTKSYRHSWKRTDAGSETVLAYGDFLPQIATQK